MLVQTYQGEYTYRLFLCSTNKSILCELDYKNIIYKPFFNNYNELQFEIDYYDNGSDWSHDARYDLLKGLYYVLLEIVRGDTVVSSEYFVITEPENTFDGGKASKNINCVASHYITFNKKRLRAYNQSGILLYDNVSNNGIINYILDEILLNTWTISYINADFLGVYHSFDFSDSTLTDVFKQLEHDFNAIFVYNNVNNTIGIYKKTEFVDNLGMTISASNFMSKLSYQPKYDQIITRLYVYGKSQDGVKTNIARYNITGQLYIDNFDWFIDNGYFSSGLSAAWTAYEATIASYQGSFTTNLNNYILYNSQLLTLQGELVTLQTQKTSLESQLDAIKRSNYTPSGTNYSTLFSSLQSKEGEVAAKEGEISSKQSSITSAENALQSIANSLAYSANFTPTELEELINFIHEDTLTMDTVDDADLLYEYAQQYVVEKSSPIYDIAIDIVDIFSAEDADVVRDKLVLGSYAYIDCPEIGFNYLPLQLVSYTHNKTDNKLSLNFSNTTKIESDLYYLNDIFKKANQTTSDVLENKGTWNQFNEQKNNLIYLGEEIDAEGNRIIAGNHYINQRGFVGTNIGGFGEIQVLADRIVFSKDAWATFFTLLSANGLYLESANAYGATPIGTESISRVVITPEYGFQIDQWNPAINNWGNVVYIGTDGQFHIDNGYIELTRIVSATPLSVEMNKILLDPSVGIKVSKNISATPATPTWFDVFYLNNDGDIQLADENGNGIIIDQFGMDTKFIKWFKNMCYNSGFEVFDAATNAPLYWTGSDATVVTSADSAFFNTKSLKLPVGTSCVQSGSGVVNPQFYNNVSTKTRIAFHKKFGKVKVEVLDGDNADAPWSLTDSDGNVALYIEYDYNANWIPESYTFTLTHGSSTKLKLKFTNTDNADAYIDAVIIEPDYTGRRPSFYTDGPNSISASTIVDLNDYVVVQSGIYVQPDEPSTPVEKDLWIDTDDYSRYDVQVVSTDTLVSLGSQEYISVESTTNPISLTLHTAVGNAGVIFRIKNKSDYTVDILSAIDGEYMTLFPSETIEVISNGAEWSI